METHIVAGHSEVDAVRDSTDLVRLIGEHVALRPKGREHVGLCPFHNDKNPSFCVVTHKGNAFYKCHACGAGGDAFDFVMNYHKMEFGEALRLLADRAGITLQPRTRHGESAQTSGQNTTRAELRKANAFAATFFQRMLNDQNAGAKARDVIARRGISAEMVPAFGIGAAPDQWDALTNLLRKRSLPESLFVSAGLLKRRKEGDGHYDAFRNRLIFPICDDVGNPIAFGARKINPEDEPKYLNSAESAVFSKSKTLYGLHRAKRAIIDAKQAIVTEGYTDVIACHQAGICNVVGTLGTALTRDHARVLARLCDTVVLLFDGDEAGQKAADRGLEVFFAEPVDVKVCMLPDELDPDELLKQDGGRERFIEVLNTAVDAMQFKIERFREQLQSAAGISARQKRLEAFMAELSNLGFASVQGVKKRMVLAQLADSFGVSLAEIETMLPKKRATATPAEDVKPELGESEVEAELGADDADLAFAHADISAEHVFVEPVPSARRRAEEQLLAVLIYQPDLHTSTITLNDGRAGSFTTVFEINHFADPITRTVAQAIMQKFARQELFTVQQLMTAITQPHARQLISSLYFEGQRQCDFLADPVDALHQAANCLLSHLGLQDLHSTISQFRLSKHAPDQAEQAARSVIEKLRRQGAIATAISRGVRS